MILEQDSSCILSASLLILKRHLQMFDFKSQETIQTKILRKLWRATLHNGVEV